MKFRKLMSYYITKNSTKSGAWKLVPGPFMFIKN